MNKPKISVIVPVYNVEKYVEKCLKSLFDQTYQNLEIIVVNDCSTDKSLEKVKDCINNQKNVVLINNKKNSGLSYSRNEGIKCSTGDYIGFIDSDDYIGPNYYEVLMDSINQNNSEIAICDINIVDEATGCSNRSICGTYSNNKIDFINNGLAASACNKLFKKDIIEKYPFAVGKVNEDVAVVIPAIINAKKVSYTDACYYNYVQRENSIQNSKFSSKKFDIFEAVDLTLKRIENYCEYEDVKEALVFNQLITFFIYIIPKEKKFIKRYQILKKYHKLSKKYKLMSNKYWLSFLENNRRLYKIYYKNIMLFENIGAYFITNLSISSYTHFIRLIKTNKKSVINKNISLNDLIKLAKKQNNMPDAEIKVSVVVPNYNYEKFLYQRIYSILNQNYHLYEIIILDDCSTDNSRELIDNLVENLCSYVNIRKIYNEKNSGTAFKQWRKGFSNAKGEYVWIAEADDYCSNSLISSLIKPIKNNKNVLISYSDTAFIDYYGKKINKTIKPQIDLMKTGHWNKNYINSGLDEIKNYSFLNCTIANVSGCIIKNNDYDEYLKESSEYKQAGDWLFYVNVMKDGNIAYTDKTLNYYRVHGNNVSSTMNHKAHIEEIKKIHSKLISEFKLQQKQKDEMKKRIEFLRTTWKIVD